METDQEEPCMVYKKKEVVRGFWGQYHPNYLGLALALNEKKSLGVKKNTYEKEGGPGGGGSSTTISGNRVADNIFGRAKEGKKSRR